MAESDRRSLDPACAEREAGPPTADGGQETSPVTRHPSPITPVACAYCDSTDTELMSLFGQHLLGSQYYCRNCHSVFEAVRWTEDVERNA